MNPSQVNDLIAGQLRAECALRGWSGAKIARRLRVDPLWVTRRLAGSTTITVEDLLIICRVIGAYPIDVLAQITEGVPMDAPLEEVDL